MEKLFIYGTLQDSEIQKTIIGRLIQGVTDKLADYKKGTITTDDGTYPVIIPEIGSIIEGQVITITETELKEIDIYETEAYQRIKVTLVSGQEAWVYREGNE
jgi:gamma-glutamylcyclotransferase (GGCT)/AIG2-like uncharacterized protein YtfP